MGLVSGFNKSSESVNRDALPSSHPKYSEKLTAVIAPNCINANTIICPWEVNIPAKSQTCNPDNVTALMVVNSASTSVSGRAAAPGSINAAYPIITRKI